MLPEYEGKRNFETLGYKFTGATQEQLRAPRIVRIGIIQHSIVLPTTEPIKDQRNAIYEKILEYATHAARCNVNVLCLQEAWRE